MPAKQYVSEIALRLQVMDESSWQPYAMPMYDDEDGRPVSLSGYTPRDYEKDPLGSGVGAVALPQALLDQYPDEKVWRERFKELEAKGQDIPTILQKSFEAGVWCGLNQNPTNYCWCYAVIHAIMIQRLLNGEPFHRLSPYSVACIVKNFSNNGGWGGEACAQVVKEGVATEEFWPMEKPTMSGSERSSANMSAIRNGRQYLASSRANAAMKRCTEFNEVPARSIAHKMAALCVPLPVASGYNRIGHERCTIAGIITSSGALGYADLDSYTDNGRPDIKLVANSFGAGEDMVIPRVGLPSNA